MSASNSFLSNLRQKRYTDPERALLLAALSAFISDGYKGATTRSIAEAADAGSTTTLFRSFGGKQELYQEVFDFCWREINDLLAGDTYVPKPEYATPVRRLLHDFAILAQSFGDPHYNQAITFVSIALRRPEHLNLDERPYPEMELFERRLHGLIEPVRIERKLKQETSSLADRLVLYLQMTWASWLQQEKKEKLPTLRKFIEEMDRLLHDDDDFDEESAPADDPLLALA